LKNEEGIQVKKSMEKTIPLKQDPEFVMPKSGLDGIYHIELSAEEY
jgi:hypothetical protein